MQPIAFCNRCRGMKVGWNRRYVLHCLACQEWLSKSYKYLILTAILSSFVFAFPVSTGVALTDLIPPEAGPAIVEASAVPAPLPAPGVSALESMLATYGAGEGLRPRVARAILASSAKYGVDARLVASIVIVESRADQFAVSDSDSIGIMQIHLRTWGPIADRQNINLFKIEDNVDLGVRILKGYIVGSGLWEGVARYKGRSETPESYQAAAEYVQKVQTIYEARPNKPALD